ncbi:MAG: Na/Pi cotransporter family protein [Lachnospiraceae bacterium]|nr:Na/Pi cotransporter family protein [Lachnospiraceae bacterium]MDY5742167.1 Na/Pi cotransporter family protein [Lachnospiraceae bacterium]
MTIFNGLSLLGGLALFLFGMDVMGKSLTKTSGGKLESILGRLTSSKFKAVLLGLVVTGVIQSSSGTTVMVVGFVNSGIMQLGQAVGIIMGANIGTTVTSWLLSLVGVSGSNIWLQLLKPSSFAPVLAAIGIVFLMFTKNEKKHDIGSILLGFAVLMFGMETMSAAVKPLAEVPQFREIFLLFSNPILGMLMGTLLTVIIQSSSASVGILQALCATGTVGYSSVLPIIMGQNIGTCITALLSSIGTGKNAKRAAFVHLYFNLLGTILFMSVFYLLNTFVHFAFMNEMANPLGIAILHSVFNVVTTLFFYPFSGVLVKLAKLTVRDSAADLEADREFMVLDERFLATPSFAIEQSRLLTVRMSTYCLTAIKKANQLLKNFTPEGFAEVVELENKTDRYEDEIGKYSIRISDRDINELDSIHLNGMLHSIGDLERIGDHAINLAESAQELANARESFSEIAYEEVAVLQRAVEDVMKKAFKAFATEDIDLAKEVEPLEEVIDCLHKKIKERHIRRLMHGACTPRMGFILSDILQNLERVSDHCSNIAVYVIQGRDSGFEPHEYRLELEQTERDLFARRFETAKEIYRLPKKEQYVTGE